MIKEFYYKTRLDNVKLYKRLDVVVDENNEPVLDDNNNPIPTGFMIKKINTDEYYDVAIDIEGTPYRYETTTIEIETVEEPEETESEEETVEEQE